jgi:hypothetical protein
MNNICFSGGAKGADLSWGKVALENNHDLIHFTFRGHSKLKSDHIKILTQEELNLADPILIKANAVLKRSWPAHSEFVNNLLRRNYYQIMETKSIYAIAGIDGLTVFGGTAWAVEMFKILYPDNNRIYVFDQLKKSWFQWNFINWIKIDKPPIPSGAWTGIGTRELTDDGIREIENVFSTMRPEHI